MKYFTIEELCASATAKALGIDNTPTPEVVANLTALIDNVLDPLRERYGKPIIVTSGYRCPKLNKAVGGVANSQHCFDEQTELLTASGWKKHNELEQGELIYTYSMEKGCIELLPINEIVSYPYNGKMMHIQNKQLDICVTDEHRMLVRYACHKYKRRNTRNITPKGQEYFDSLKTDNDKYHIELAKEVFGKRRFFLCAGTYDAQSEGCDNMDFYKLLVAVVADGNYTTTNGNVSGIMFHLKKERKIQHVQDILNNLGYHYTIQHPATDGSTVIWCNTKVAKPIYEILGKEKLLPLDFLKLSWKAQEELLYEYAFYDGCHDKRTNCNNVNITSVNKRNIDLIQAMCTLTNKRSVISVKKEMTYNIRGKTGLAQTAYLLSINKKRNEGKCGENKYAWEDYNGIVWCANNDNTTVITRRNGKVSIQGNCRGQAADIVGTPRTKEEIKKLFVLIKAMQLDIDQCLDEKNYSWVHVSYKKDGKNRRQYLSV